MRVIIISNAKRDPGLAAAARIAETLKRSGHSAPVTELTGFIGNDALNAAIGGFDYVIVLGGDGTVLSVVPNIAIAGVPILNINLGFVGYLSAFGVQNLESDLERFIAGNIEIQNRLMLDVGGQLALNEAVIYRGGSTRPISLEVFGEHLRGDGLIIATPTGSTAYSFAAGGQSAEPCEDALLFTPVCAQVTSRKLSGAAELCVTLTGEVPALLSIDGKTSSPLKPGDSVNIKRSSVFTKLVKIKNI
jgi:NAD+ kinase